MMNFFKKKTIVKEKKTPKEAFLYIGERLDKLMQPNEKIHLYKEEDLIGYLTEGFDLMNDIEQEMIELVGLSVDYPNFKEKGAEFKTLCEGIADLLDIAIDNLRHFQSFKSIDNLIHERDRATCMLRSFSIVNEIDTFLDLKKEDFDDNASDTPEVRPSDFNVDLEEFEEAKKEGIFKGLSIDESNNSYYGEEEKEKPLDEEGNKEEKKDQQAGILLKTNKESLNKLVIKRMELLMNRAKNRTSLKGKMHEKRVKEIREGKFKICVPAVTLVFKYLVKMFNIIKETMQDAIKNKQKSSFKTFMIYASKFSLVSEVLFSSFYAEEHDIYYKDLSHDDWERFFEVYDFYEADDLQKFNKQYKTLGEFLALGSAFISKSGNSDNIVQQFFGQARYAAYYLLFKKKRMEQFNMFMSNPDIDLCLKVYNIPETEFAQTMTEFTLPSIKVHQVIYLPMLDDLITIENLETTAKNFEKKGKLDDLKGDNPSKKSMEKEEEKKQPISFKETPYTHKQMIGLELMKSHYIEELSHAKNPMYLTRSQLYKPEKHVMVRILSPIEFPVDWKNRMLKYDMIEEVNRKKKGIKNESFLSSFSKRSTTFTQQQTGFFQWGCLPPFSANINEPKRAQTNKETDNFIEIDAIMIHIHGGGFVAMSSASHQNYTRKWANEIGIPIFSIDYRLAPEHPYPAALNDVWQAYYWIINHCETHFGIRPKKVFISGDSAGGNLTLALTMLAIEKEFRVPDFVLPSYPALNLSLRNFSPSLILSLDDFILPSSFLMLGLESYVKEACPEKDHFLSPGICPDHVLRKFPPIRILIAGNDPLRDESYKFTMKLLKNNVDVKVFEFIGYPHGFLSFELPLGGIDEGVKGNEKAIAYFKEFLPKNEENVEDAVIRIEKKKTLPTQKELNSPFEHNSDEEEQEGSANPNIDIRSSEDA